MQRIAPFLFSLFVVLKSGAAVYEVPVFSEGAKSYLKSYVAGDVASPSAVILSGIDREASFIQSSQSASASKSGCGPSLAGQMCLKPVQILRAKTCDSLGCRTLPGIYSGRSPAL